MKAVLIQMNSGDDKQANLQLAIKLIQEAIANERPDWI